jgi:hypothetical protein
MKSLKLTLLAAALALSGCATTSGPAADGKTVGAVTGALIGCVGGAVLAKVTGANPAAGCLAGGAVGGFVGFEKARQQEIADAEQAQQQAIAAVAAMPGGQSAKAGDVKTVEVTATDKTSGQTRKYQAFESVSVDLPLSAKGTPEYDEAVGKLKTLAQRVADERGSARIEVALTRADARAHKVALETATVNTAKGNPITVSKAADSTVPKGMERFTVRAGALRSTEV